MRIVIEGAGQVGSHLAKMLSREANEITVIDSDAKRLSQLTAIADVVAVQGMPSSIKVMRDAGVPGCDLFIAVNPFVPQDVNVVSALLAKKIGAKKVTARLEDEEFLSSAESASQGFPWTISWFKLERIRISNYRCLGPNTWEKIIRSKTGICN